MIHLIAIVFRCGKGNGCGGAALKASSLKSLKEVSEYCGAGRIQSMCTFHQLRSAEESDNFNTTGNVIFCTMKM